MINPNVVEGQIAGGTVQGIGGALLENMVYDDDGNPLSSTFVDYLLPTATEVPPIEFGHVEIPGPGVGGYKGCGRGRRHRVDTRGHQRHQRRAGPAGRDAHPAARQPRRDRRTDRTSQQAHPERTTRRGAEQRIPSRGARRQDVGGAHRRRARRPVHPRRPAAVGRRRRLHRRGEGQGRPDHGVLQGRCVVPGEGRGRAASGASRPAARRHGAAATPRPSSPRSSRTRATPPHVVITTDLTISGKAAQFGRGVLADVSSNLIGQFARNLEAELLGGSAPRPRHVRDGSRARRRCRSRRRSTPSIC